MKQHKGFKIFLGILAGLLAIFLIYTGNWYHADARADAYLEGSETVSVDRLSVGGWLFDGPGSEKALVFYPGAKVDTRAYAGIAEMLAEDGIDVFLLDMPFHMAFFGVNKADQIIDGRYGTYEEWYIGGHSLGGAMAGSYASKHQDMLDGIVFLASYPTADVSSLKVLSVYGSNDGVLNRTHYEAGKQYWPADAEEVVIAGGNHAQFGDYGAQKGDHAAEISAASQQAQTVEAIRKAFE